MDYIIRIVRSLENAVLLIGGVSETVKHKFKKQEGGFLGVIRNFRYFNVRKYVDWKRCNGSRKWI